MLCLQKEQELSRKDNGLIPDSIVRPAFYLSNFLVILRNLILNSCPVPAMCQPGSTRPFDADVGIRVILPCFRLHP